MQSKSYLILFFVFITAITISAQSLAIGPQIGIQKTKDSDESSVLFGGAARLKLSSGFAVEGAINYRKDKFLDGNYTATSYPVMVTGMLYILPIAYIAGGGGWYNVKHEYSAAYKLMNPGLSDETTSEFAYHFGGGGEVDLGKILLTADVRYVFFDMKVDNVAALKDLNTNFYVITAGILFEL